MHIPSICKGYFNGFQEIGTIKKNDGKTNLLAIVKIFSYCTLVLPLVFGTI